jgi:hypothetical protein
MNEDLHGKAKRLQMESMVEGISPSNRQWLAKHLEGCPRCAAMADRCDAAVASIRSVPVSVDPALVTATKKQVRLRAGELQSGGAARLLLWTAGGLSWAWTAASAPLIWRGLDRIAERLEIPDPVWQMAFGLWWFLPALVIGGVLLNSRRWAEMDHGDIGQTPVQE